jgi:hypothetical protein
VGLGLLSVCLSVRLGFLSVCLSVRLGLSSGCLLVRLGLLSVCFSERLGLLSVCFSERLGLLSVCLSVRLILVRIYSNRQRFGKNNRSKLYRNAIKLVECLSNSFQKHRTTDRHQKFFSYTSKPTFLSQTNGGI